MYEQIDAYVLRLIEESTPERTVWNVEKLRQGKPADWNYIMVPSIQTTVEKKSVNMV